MARMLSNYTCAGGSADEVYTTHFSSFGFQFVQIEGYPGVPMSDALTAHFIGASNSSLKLHSFPFFKYCL
jgi:hypothetical protein